MSRPRRRAETFRTRTTVCLTVTGGDLAELRAAAIDRLAEFCGKDRDVVDDLFDVELIARPLVYAEGLEAPRLWEADVRAAERR